MGAPLVPLNAWEGVDALSAAGAEEFYVGFFDPRWQAAFGPYSDANRLSGFGAQANAFTFEQMLAVVRMAKMRGKRVYATFNAAAYGAEAGAFIEGYFQQLAWAGADGVILSGPELIDCAHACGLAAVASTMCAVYNRDIARFYAECGAERIILPRDLSISEIASIVEAVPDVQYEVFLMRNGCMYSDAHCLGVHGMSCGALCGEMRRATRRIRTSGDVQEAARTSTLHARSFHKLACGLCALWDFEQMGIDAYKVVGRCDELSDIAVCTRMVARNIGIARACATRRAYLEAMEMPANSDALCNRRLNCYYPDALDDAEGVVRAVREELAVSGAARKYQLEVRRCGRLKPRCPCHRGPYCEFLHPGA